MDEKEVQRLEKENKVLKHKLKRINRNLELLEGRWDRNSNLFQTLHEEIEKARKAAEEANEAKSIFLANMSHEIRTPMNAILGFAEILSSSIVGEQQLEYLSAIRTSGKSLLLLINDILDLSKIEAGKMELEYVAVDVRSLFQEVLYVFSAKIQDKGIELIIEFDETLPVNLVMDEIRMRQVLLNLVGNAVKFTETGYVKVSVNYQFCDENKNSLDFMFSVEDSGIGINADQIRNIFNAFAQQKGQAYGKYGGTGLGLAITKNLVDMMDGEIEVSSEIEQGSVFTVRLKNIEIDTNVDVKPTHSFDVGTVCFDPATILVVDDVELNRNLVCGYLANYDLTILEAANGKEAFDCVTSFKPSLVLMDMKMPVMDGYEATTKIKAEPECETIPIVALTATAMKQSEAEIKELCDGYIHKPVSKNEVVEELMKFLDYSIIDPVSSGQSEKGVNNDWSVALSYTHVENFTALYREIEEELLPMWDSLKDCSIITDFTVFADAVHSVAEKYDYEPLLLWSQFLIKQINTFDLDKINEIMQKFPGVVREINTHIESVD